MFNQNTTTVLTTLITVLGTLGGAIIGVVLTNRHGLRLETLKMKQEKGKKNAEIIEEVYSLLRKIRACSGEIFDQEKNPREELANEIDRVETLVRLYLPSIVPPLDSWLEYTEHSNIMSQFDRVEELLEDEAHKPDIQTQAKRLAKKWTAPTEYYSRLDAISTAIEKLVRNQKTL